ncbi:hypothetical protein [Shimia sp. SDUM112013]|uniref:hypothetical protein n=1 Tax=Shimia sp. SDUM112013 TaxID=3136160 RepID=UPI0032EE8574
MPETSKIFSVEHDGLSYTVTVYQDEDGFHADIAVNDGAMDVNAIYYGDDDFSGDSEKLSGPLNMNGADLDGEDVQWDSAIELSRPGLGREGEDKETYLTEGDTLTIDLDISSLDEIDVFGIRATSTTTEEGSIKHVMDDPEEPEEPEEPTFDKVGFGYDLYDNGVISNGVYISDENLPEDEEPTFANYVGAFEDNGGEVQELESVVFFEMVQSDTGEEYPSEIFRLDAPEGGYASSDELLADFDEAVASGAFELEGAGDEGLEMMAALSLDVPEDEYATPEDEIADEDPAIEIA